jgi:hypothetical protein
MRHMLDTEPGGGLYAKRQAMIEPVFADTKYNRRCDRFQRRCRSAARSEWRLITATPAGCTPRPRCPPRTGGPSPAAQAEVSRGGACRFVVDE